MSAPLHVHIAAARQALVNAGLRPDNAALDADVLAREALGWDRARLLAHSRDPAPDGFRERFDAMIARRAQREPVAMITGHREFWGLEFEVTPATLVPRPETELIVEEAVRQLPAGVGAQVVDIGTGTGCLAVAIARERPAVTVVATDISHAALLVARRNAQRHGVDRCVRFVQGSLASPLRIAAQLIVSNPPYVPEQAAPALAPDVVRYEPAIALFSGGDGLSLIRQLFASVPAHLAPGGTFIVEFGFGQEDSVRAAAEECGWTVVRMLHDLQDIARTAVLRR